LRRRNLESVAKRLAGILGKDGLLIGGMAVMAHGYVRATQDVDFVVPDLTEAEKRLGEHGISVKRLRGDFSCLRGTLDGVRFDLLPPLVPLDWQRAVAIPFTKRSTIYVVDLDGLIRLKLRAGGPKDLMDVGALVLRNPELRERTLEWAIAYKVRDRVEAWLADPRLEAELQESTVSERAFLKRRRPRP
jgi:hypothetical protein